MNNNDNFTSATNQFKSGEFVFKTPNASSRKFCRAEMDQQHEAVQKQLLAIVVNAFAHCIACHVASQAWL
jgi:hypothetical protein